MKSLKGQQVYLAFDRFGAIHIFADADSAFDFIMMEADTGLFKKDWEKRVSELKQGFTVYPNEENTLHEIRAVRTDIK